MRKPLILSEPLTARQIVHKLGVKACEEHEVTARTIRKARQGKRPAIERIQAAAAGRAS